MPAEIERIIGRALRKDRETRYQSVGELLIDLQDCKREAEFQAKLQTPARVSGEGRIGLDNAAACIGDIFGPGFLFLEQMVMAGGAVGDCGSIGGLLSCQEIAHSARSRRARGAWRFFRFEISIAIPKPIFSDSPWQTRSSPNSTMLLPLPCVHRLRSTNIAIRSSTQASRGGFERGHVAYRHIH